MEKTHKKGDLDGVPVKIALGEKDVNYNFEASIYLEPEKENEKNNDPDRFVKIDSDGYEWSDEQNAFEVRIDPPENEKAPR